MNILKRYLAMFLVICMMVSAVPVSVFASETDGTVPEAAEATDAPEVTDAPGTAETEIPGEKDASAPTGDVETLDAARAAVAGHMATKPEDGSTTNEPFPENTGGSYSFRIPALVTLSDGTLVAAADARWNTTYDGGGLDTIVSRSSDNGANWNYTFTNYLGDNGNKYASNSSCFIDPSLAVVPSQSNDTIYMLVDLYPNGVALNGNKQCAPAYDTGFTDEGYLKLTATAPSENSNNYTDADFTHYMKGGKIYPNGSKTAEAYTVDAKFNVYDNDGAYVGNLFFEESPYHVARTGYLYLTKSTDKGATWSDPILLNLKTEFEQVCLVGPGRGLATTNGTIVFPIYSYAGESAKFTGLIYSTDNGTSWQRSSNLNQLISSEATMVELDNGKIRTFFRNDNATLCYSDFDLANGSWGAYVDTKVKCNSDTELSAIVYSQQVEHGGKLKDVVLVSCPAGPNAAGTDNNNGAYRCSGTIFAGLIDPDTYEMTWLSEKVEVTDVVGKFSDSVSTYEKGFFGYSCLTEQKDNGSVSILYEDSQQGWGSGTGYGYTMNFKTYTESELETALGVTFAADTNTDGDEPQKTVVDVTVKVGQIVEKTIEGVALNGSSTNTTATVTWAGTNAVKRMVPVTADNPIVSGKQYVIANANTGAVLTDTPVQSSGDWGAKPGLDTTGTASVDCQELWTITESNGKYTVVQNNKYLAIAGFEAHLYDRQVLLALKCTDAGWTIYDDTTGPVLGHGAAGYYLSDNVGNNYDGDALGTSVDSNTAIYWNIYEIVTDTPVSTAVTITGKQVGTTAVDVGNTTYNITVVTNGATKFVDVELLVGETEEYTDDTGNYENHANNMDPYDQIATMTVDGETVAGNTTEQLVPVTPPTSAGSIEAYISDGNGNFLSLNGKNLTNVTNINNATKWTITYVDTPNWANGASRYTVNSGSYYVILNGSALGAQRNANSNHNHYHYFTTNAGFYGSSNGSNAWIYNNNGWTVGTGGSNSAKLYDIQTVTTDPVSSTTITFTGVSPGQTTAVVGNTQYNITVISLEQTVNIELEVGETFTYTDTTGHYAQLDTNVQPDGIHATMKADDLPAIGTKDLVEVTSANFNPTKRYVIVNQRATNPSHSAYQPDHAVLTATEIAGGAIGLDMNGPLSKDTTDVWVIVSDGNSGYYLKSGGEYVTIGNTSAEMTPTATSLTLAYNAANAAWIIMQDGYYLSDLYGTGSGEAFGTNDAGDDGNYWTIYEVVDTRPESTQVAFTGVAEGVTTAKVGYTTYNITVVAQETDDEVENTGTNIWTVDPEEQAKRIEAATVTDKDSYSDASREAYETALNAANNKMEEVRTSTYPTVRDAAIALTELTKLVDELEAAKAALKEAREITINYLYQDKQVKSETIKVPVNSSAYVLDPSFTVDDVEYHVADIELTLSLDVAAYDVVVVKAYESATGIVGVDISSTEAQNRPINELTVTVGIEYDLNVADNLLDGQTVEWSSSNTNVANVDQNGMVTAVGEGTATITATIKNADGSVAKTYTTGITVYPTSDAGDPTRTVAVYVDKIINSSVSCVIYGNGEQYEFDVVSGELIYGKFKCGDGTNKGADTTTGVVFYGKPNAGHVMTSMTSADSLSEYFPLRKDGALGTDAGYYANKNTSAAKWLAIGLSGNNGTTITDAAWKKIVDTAQKYAGLGYDGVQAFTRRMNENPLNLHTNLTFVSEPLPAVDKTVDGVLPTGGKFANYQRYVENMVAGVDEIVFFTITVTVPRPTVWEMENGTEKTDAEGRKYGAVEYTTAALTDELTDAYFYTKELDQADGTWDGLVANANSVQDIKVDLNKPWADDETERILKYNVAYQIKESDVPRFMIENKVAFTYNYKSKYSAGTMTAGASADAKITVIHTAIDNVVIDFGQPIVYSGLTGDQLRNVYLGDQNKIAAENNYGTVAKYGQVTVTEVSKDNYTVTYMPTSILREPDMVILYGKGTYIDENGQEQTADGKIINGFIVYPATTVYYEEGYAFTDQAAYDSTKWNLSSSKSATVEQELEKLGQSIKDSNGQVSIVSGKVYDYGFDPIYNTNDALNKSYAVTTAKDAKTSFTFTGDGIQVFANCTTGSGYVCVEVKNEQGRIVRMSMVDTAVKAGETDATIGQVGNMAGLPVVSLLNVQKMPHGTYTVTIAKVMDSDPVYLDGIRIFNTVAKNDNDSPFTIDLEDRPDFYELRDAVLHAVGVNADTSEDYRNLTQQIYDATKGSYAVITDESVSYADSSTIQDLLDKGPKNELFLYPGQTLSFTVTTRRVLQVGLKAPQGATEATVAVTGSAEKTISISSVVDMFHTLVERPAGTEKAYQVSIKNTGEKLLSATLLKICDDPDAAFAELTEEDIAHILQGVYGKGEGKSITLVSQPADAQGIFGEKVRVAVKAVGEDLKYRWYLRNAGDEEFQASDCQTNTYSITMSKQNHGQQVYCVISDAKGNEVVSQTVTLSAADWEDHNHSFVDYVSNNDATCTTDGTKTAECEYCYEKDTIADEGSATGHDFDKGVCVVCGQQKEEYIPGNIDDDGDVDVDDVLSLLWNVLFPEDYPIHAEADFDGNGTVDVDDVLVLLWYVLFPEEYPLN